MSEEESNGMAKSCPVLPEWPEHLRDGKHTLRTLNELQFRINDIHGDTKHLETIANGTEALVRELQMLRRESSTKLFSYGVTAIVLAIAAVLVHHSLNGTPNFKWSVPGVATFESSGRSGTAHAESPSPANGRDSR